jgi:hypothetical protein
MYQLRNLYEIIYILLTIANCSYQQKRYNLFNEETEGYSKLVTELLLNSFANRKAINSLREKIQSLIGMTFSNIVYKIN